MSPTDPTKCPYYLITRASLGATSKLKAALSAANLDVVRPAYLGVLWCLWKQDDVKVVELGRCAGLEPSTMTGLLDRMERDELVTRALDPSDRRAQRIHLTELGSGIRERAVAVVDEMLEEMLSGVSKKDLAIFERVLLQVLENTDRKVRQ